MAQSTPEKEIYTLTFTSDFVFEANGVEITSPHQLSQSQIIQTVAENSFKTGSVVRINGTEYTIGTSSLEVSLSDTDINIELVSIYSGFSPAQAIIINYTAGGVGGSMSETWVLNETIQQTLSKQSVEFASNDEEFIAFMFSLKEGFYFQDDGTEEGNEVQIYLYDSSGESWSNEAYRTITFSTAPTGDLLTWLQANGTKQSASTQKSVDLTTLSGWANLADGTHTITIKAKADGYRDSEASAGVEVTKGEPASQYTLTNNGEYIGIRVNGQNVTTPYQLRNGDVIYAYATFEDMMSNIKVNGTTYDGSTVNLSNTDITISTGAPAKTGIGVKPDVIINFSVSTGETWVLNESVNGLTLETTNVSFSSNNVTFTWINTRKGFIAYSNAEEWNDDNIVYDTANWTNNAYRTVTFSTAPTGDLLTWLQANGTKQGGVTLISFTIQDAYGNQTICKAESGMTWEQWINTSYNTLGMKLSASGYVNFPNGDSLRNGSSDVLGTDTIDSKFLYLDPAAQ